jgi:autophagy-related protein 17
MSQPSSPLPRESTHSSPSASAPRQGSDISVETLISHLVAAKRSLSSIHHVHRATNILSKARSSTESTAGLLARTTYLRRSLLSQLKILRSIQFELEGAAIAIQIEFQHVLQELDAAEQKLANTIEFLRQTRIEDAFKAAPIHQAEGLEAQTEKDNLHDFVEEKPVDELKTAMKNVIDLVQDEQHDMGRSIRNLDGDLKSINDLLTDRRSDLSVTDSDIHQPNMSRLLRSLEENAHEMAQCLESLVKHFDLCVTAIKHTEGAGDAVMRTANAGEIAEEVGVENLEAPAEPMNDDERVEMLQVLENDAGEVDEVVLEIQDRNAQMEADLDKIMVWRERSEVSHHDVATAFALLETISAKLSTYVADSARHTNRWAEEKVKIEDGIAGMEDLCDTYENFLNAYDRLIVEVARRRTVRKQMERVADDAHAKLEQLYQDDLAEREHFRSEQGDFLPSDIWYGLHALPPRFGCNRIDGMGIAGEGEEDSIPELKRSTVEGALRRLKAGMGVKGSQS